MQTVTLPNGGSHCAEFRRGSLFVAANAAVIIRYAGFTILSDPESLHDEEKVPPVDLVFLSHMPGSAFHRVAAKHFDMSTPVVTTRAAATVLERRGFARVLALNTWEPLEASKGESILRVTAMPAASASGILRLVVPPITGFMLEFSSGEKIPLRMYISGRTTVADHLKEIPRRYLNIDLALMQLDPKRAAEAIRIVGPHTAIPVHHHAGTLFRRAMCEAGVDDRVCYVGRGETFEIEVPDVRL
jgi:L-ascorbate metabolism protein UlaG (beta-lactamase superfamily)